MTDRLIPWLRCPECGTALALDEAAEHDGDEVITGRLICATGHSFSITNAIPRFVADDAYVKNFSFQWDLYRKDQLDSATGDHQSADQFHAMTHFSPSDLAGKLVLDVGCGPGKFVEVALGMGAEVVGLDLSFAVDAARENFGSHERLHLIQADVFHLPVSEGVFDAIYSLGVLHHTPDCETAFKRLPAHLKPGGEVAIWVYDQQIIPHFNRRLRSVTRRLPPRLLYYLALLPVPFTYLFNVPFLRAFFYGLQPYFQWISWGNFRQRWLDTLDWYGCWYQSAHTYPEVYRWFQDMGLIELTLGEIAVSVRGRRPPTL